MKEKCDAYQAIGILGFRKGKTYAVAAKNNEREETRYGQREKENTNKIEKGSGAKAKTSPNRKKHR